MNDVLVNKKNLIKQQHFHNQYCPVNTSITSGGGLQLASTFPLPLGVFCPCGLAVLSHDSHCVWLTCIPLAVRIHFGSKAPQDTAAGPWSPVSGPKTCDPKHPVLRPPPSGSDLGGNRWGRDLGTVVDSESLMAECVAPDTSRWDQLRPGAQTWTWIWVRDECVSSPLAAAMWRTRADFIKPSLKLIKLLFFPTLCLFISFKI